MHWLAQGLRKVQVELGVIMATQNFKRNLFLNLYREGEKYNTSLFPPATYGREKKKSDTCSLFPPFGEPWPSYLLPSQRDRLPTLVFLGSLMAQVIKKWPAMWERPGFDPGLGRSPGGEHGNPFQY